MRESEINLLLISQNVFSYDLSLPKDAILRINLAWCNNLDYLKSVLDTHKEFVFFIDLPIF